MSGIQLVRTGDSQVADACRAAGSGSVELYEMDAGSKESVTALAKAMEGKVLLSLYCLKRGVARRKQHMTHNSVRGLPRQHGKHAFCQVQLQLRASILHVVHMTGTAFTASGSGQQWAVPGTACTAGATGTLQAPGASRA